MTLVSATDRFSFIKILHRFAQSFASSKHKSIGLIHVLFTQNCNRVLIFQTNYKLTLACYTESWKPAFVTDQVEARSDEQHLFFIYINRSIELARQHHPGYDHQQLVTAARQEFDNASQVFWNASLALAKQLRPHGELVTLNTSR